MYVNSNVTFDDVKSGHRKHCYAELIIADLGHFTSKRWNRYVSLTATCSLSLLAHLGPGDDDPDEADVVGADAVQALVDALREELPAVVARLDCKQAERQPSDESEIDSQNSRMIGVFAIELMAHGFW